MSERDELLKVADAAGFKVDKRQGTDKIRDVLAEAGLLDGIPIEPDLDDDEVTSRDWDDDELVDEAPVEGAMADQPAEPEDGWPKRIAPCVWLDQDGTRHTDMGLAHEAAEQIRQRS